MDFMELNWTLKNSGDGKIYLLCILPQLNKKKKIMNKFHEFLILESARLQEELQKGGSLYLALDYWVCDVMQKRTF
jgi:hypothetical protein